MKETIYITQTITYNHSIEIETGDNDSDDLIHFLNNHTDDEWYGELSDIQTDIEDAGYKILNLEEDGSGDCTWEFE